MRILLASSGGAGHVGPLVPLGQACRRAGHEVLFAVPPAGARLVDASGLARWPLGVPDAEELAAVWARVPALPVEQQNRVVIGDVFARLNVLATLEDLRRACREWRPDVVVRETTEYGSALAAELEGVRHARLNFGLAATDEMALEIAAPPLDRLRRAHGLSPDPDAGTLRAAPCLTWFPRSLEDPAHPGGPGMLRMRDRGWDAPAAPLPDWWPAARARDPLVYVTFGSVAGSLSETAPVFGMAMEALSALPVRALLTVGTEVDLGALPAAPANVRVERWVPQADVLGHADAVVCHGGSGSTLGALAAGRPLVVVPLFADQPHNAGAVAATGAGLSVPPEASAVRAALGRVLAEPAFAARAASLAAEMRGQRHPVAALLAAAGATDEDSVAA